MQFFERLKKLFQREGKQAASTTVLLDPIPSVSGRAQTYFRNVDRNGYRDIATISLPVDTEAGETFFTVQKSHPNLSELNRRSRKKFAFHYQDEKQFVVSAAKVIEIVREDSITRITLKETRLEEFLIVEANGSGAILQKGTQVAFLNFSTGKSYIQEYEWNPFRTALADGYWLVGTRQTTEGPGELYCFSMEGDCRWGIRFLERMNGPFGEVLVTSYHLNVSEDSSDIIVSSMDKVYRFLPDGTLAARIALSELREEDLRKKEERDREELLSRQIESKEDIARVLAYEMVRQMLGGFQRISLNASFAGLAHDPNTDRLFIFEQQGRLTCWDSTGGLAWSITFEGYGRFIRFVGQHVVISLVSGHTFWLDREGKVDYAAALPDVAEHILPVSETKKFLIVCNDNRLYQLDQQTGQLTTGPAGNRSMRLFTFGSSYVFYDGAGYLWLAPEAYQWNLDEIERVDHTVQQEVDFSRAAPEVNAVKPFKSRWVFQHADKPILERLVDAERERIYCVLSLDRNFLQSIEEIEKQDQYEVVCYDFSLNRLWSFSGKKYIFSIALSPDGETLFVGHPKRDELAYASGEMLMFDTNAGKRKGKFPIPGIRFYTENISNDEIIFQFSQEVGSVLYKAVRSAEGHWTIGNQVERAEKGSEFGAGLATIELPSYQLKRTDKKQYNVKTSKFAGDLKVAAAIYEFFELNDGNLLLRIGNKSIRLYDDEMKMRWEFKTPGNVQQIVLSMGGMALVMKEEIAFIDMNGQPKWRLAAPPKPVRNDMYWIDDLGVFLWGVGNQQSITVCTITEEGNIINSQTFEEADAYNGIHLLADQTAFYLHYRNSIQCFNL